MCFNRNLSYHINDTSSNGTNLKILTWNIEGYMTKKSDENTENKLNISYVKKMCTSYDVIILTETWTNSITETDINITGYRPFYCSRTLKHKDANRESGGIAVLVKNYLLKYIKRQPTASEDSIWLKIDRSIASANKDIYLGAIYLPPEKSSYYANQTIDSWDVVEREITIFKGKGDLLLCGDFNARTGRLQDFIPHDCHDKYVNLPNSYTPDPHNIIERNNLDCTINSHGRRLVNICTGQYLGIINGRTPGDFFGNFTCLKYNGSSLVDYNLISKNLFSFVDKFQVLPYLGLSDHRPIALCLKIKSILQDVNNSENITLTDAPGKYILESQNKYIDTLLMNQMQEKIRDFNTTDYNGSAQGVDHAVDDFNSILKDAASISGRYVKVKKKKRIHKEWVDFDCFRIRKDVQFCKNLYDKFPNNRVIRESYYKLNKKYRKIRRMKENAFKDNILNSI